MGEVRKAAGEVGAKIIGPMRRLPGGDWDWRRQSNRSLEAAVASWVVARLEDEGHQIIDLWSPENEPRREPEIDKRPELAMTLDGERAGLDVTWFLTTEAGNAAGRAARVRNHVEAGLRTVRSDRSVYVFVVYDRGPLLALPKRALEAEAQGLLEALAGAIEESVDRSVVRLDLPFAWIKSATVTVTQNVGERRTITVALLPPRADAVRDVDVFVQARIASKGPQLEPWGRGILVIIHGGDETPEDVAAGFARAEAIPWWRVYWVGRSPDEVHLVAARAR